MMSFWSGPLINETKKTLTKTDGTASDSSGNSIFQKQKRWKKQNAVRNKNFKIKKMKQKNSISLNRYCIDTIATQFEKRIIF